MWSQFTKFVCGNKGPCLCRWEWVGTLMWYLAVEVSDVLFFLNLFCLLIIFLFNILFHFLLVLNIYLLIYLFIFCRPRSVPRSPFPHVTVSMSNSFRGRSRKVCGNKRWEKPLFIFQFTSSKGSLFARRDRGFSLLRLIFCIFILWSISANVGAFSFLNKNCKGREPKRLSLEFPTLPLVRCESAN